MNLGWLMSIIIIIWTFFSQYDIGSKDYVLNVKTLTNFVVIHQILWILAQCWIVFVCHTNNGGNGFLRFFNLNFIFSRNESIDSLFFFFFSGAVNRFLSHHWFIVFSKISYSFYLIQFVFFFYDVATIRYPDTFQIFKLVKYHFIPSRKILPPFSPPPILLQIINSMFQINGSEFVSLLFWSIVVTLIFDIPMQEVKNYIMRK